MVYPTGEIISEKYTEQVKPFFNSEKDYVKTRDEFIEKILPEIEKLNEKRRKSEEAAQTKRYR